MQGQEVWWVGAGDLQQPQGTLPLLGDHLVTMGVRIPLGSHVAPIRPTSGAYWPPKMLFGLFAKILIGGTP
jgi:hypothetical protein